MIVSITDSLDDDDDNRKEGSNGGGGGATHKLRVLNENWVN